MLPYLGEKESTVFKKSKKTSLIDAFLATGKKQASKKSKVGKAALGLGAVAAVGTAIFGRNKPQQ